MLVALLAGGHLLIEGVPGLAKTLTVQDRRPTSSAAPSAASSSRPTSSRPTSSARASTAPGPATLRHRARPRLLQLPAGRRDQPRAGQGAVGAARGHAGAPGHDRRRDPSRPRAVPGAGDAEPDRVGGHLPPARGPARPLHAEGAGRLPAPRRRDDGRRARARRAGRSARQVLDLDELAAPEPRPRRSTSTRRGRATPSRWPTPRASRRAPASASSSATSPTAPAPRPDQPGARRPAPWPRCAAAATSCRRTSRELAPDVLRHRIVLSYEALAEEVPPDTILDAVLEAVRRPRIDPPRGRVTCRRPRQPARAHAGRPGPGPLPGGAAGARPVACAADRRPAGRRVPLRRARRGHRARPAPAVRAGRRRPPDRLERHRPHRRAARPRRRRRAGPHDLARARRVALDALRHGRPAQGGRGRGRRPRARPRRDPPRQPARPGHRSAAAAGGRAAATGPGRPVGDAPDAAPRSRRHERARRDVPGRRARARLRATPASRALSSSWPTCAARATGAAAAPARRPPRRPRDRDPRPARAGAARRRRARARRSRDRPPAARRHPQPRLRERFAEAAAAERARARRRPAPLPAPTTSCCRPTASGCAGLASGLRQQRRRGSRR